MQKSLPNEYLISDDKSLLNIKEIHSNLTHSYWANGIPFETVKLSIENSYCVGVFKNTEQIGFARLVTDYATFAYLADVFIVKDYQSKGLSKELLKFILGLDWVKGLRNIMLATHDAHKLYKPFGFTEITYPQRYMHKFNLNIYEGEGN